MSEYKYGGLSMFRTGDIDPKVVSNHKNLAVKWFTKDDVMAGQHRRAAWAAKGKKGSEANDPNINLSLVHELQSNFHRDRGIQFLEMAKLLSNLEGAGGGAYSVPSLYDKYPDELTHTLEEAIRYHTQLMGETLIGACKCREIAKMCKESDSDSWNVVAQTYDNLSQLHTHYTEGIKSRMTGDDMTGPMDMMYLSTAAG